MSILKVTMNLFSSLYFPETSGYFFRRHLADRLRVLDFFRLPEVEPLSHVLLTGLPEEIGRTRVLLDVVAGELVGHDEGDRLLVEKRGLA